MKNKFSAIYSRASKFRLFFFNPGRRHFRLPGPPNSHFWSVDPAESGEFCINCCKTIFNYRERTAILQVSNWMTKCSWISQGCGRPGDFIYLPRSFVGAEKPLLSDERDAIRADNGNQSSNTVFVAAVQDQDDPENVEKNEVDVNREWKRKAMALQIRWLLRFLLQKRPEFWIRKFNFSYRNQWLRYRYGVFADAHDEAAHGEEQTDPEVGSMQHSLCYGKSVADVIAQHPDIQGSRGGVGRNNAKSGAR